MPESLKKHTLNLRDGDYEFLNSLSRTNPASAIIRKLISNHVDNLRARLHTEAPATLAKDYDVDL